MDSHWLLIGSLICLKKIYNSKNECYKIASLCHYHYSHGVNSWLYELLSLVNHPWCELTFIPLYRICRLPADWYPMWPTWPWYFEWYKWNRNNIKYYFNILSMSRIWLPFHHMDFYTTLTVALHLRLQFPSFTALTTHTLNTQLIALITQLIALITQLT